MCSSSWQRRAAVPAAARVTSGRPGRSNRAGSRSSPTGRSSAPTDHPRVRGSRRGGRATAGPSRDYPRVRGEQWVDIGLWGYKAGSPPRARGAGADPRPRQRSRRITPACAGSRRWLAPSAAGSGDHPRVRGEQGAAFAAGGADGGLPPRARGADVRVLRAAFAFRITPACAGSSGWSAARTATVRVHPRVRGEQPRNGAPAA